MNRVPLLFIAGSVVSLTGCSTTPDVSITYYFPEAKAQISIVQTLGCDDLETFIRSVSTVIVTPSYSTDLRGASPRTGKLSFRSLDGPLSDTDTAITLTPDGRLLGVNASSTGEGATIIKTIATVAEAAAPTLGGPAPTGAGSPIKAACDVIKAYATPAASSTPAVGASAPPASNTQKTQAQTVTLNYALAIEFEGASAASLAIHPDSTAVNGYGDVAAGASLPIYSTADSKPLYDKLKTALGDLGQHLAYFAQLSPAPIDLAAVTGAAGTGASLTLNRIAQATLQVSGPRGDLSANDPIWSGSLPVPLQATYELPVPARVAFGSTQFVLSLSDSGSITKLEYAKKNGLADAATAATSALSAAAPVTPEQQATDIQGQADLIYEQRRLVICRTTPTGCPSK